MDTMGKRPAGSRCGRGFTLVEVMVGILLTGIVLGAGYQLWSAARRDVALAATRQTLANEVRQSLDLMAKDFQAMKANTLEVTASPDGNSATIKFERFPLKDTGTTIGVEGAEPVVYQYRKPRLTRNLKNQGEHVLAWNLTSLSLARGERSATDPGAGGLNDMPADESGINARMDIEMSASAKVPGSNRIASFTGHVSVFIREEFYATVNKGRFIAMSKLVATSASSLSDTDADNTMLTMGLLDPEALAKLSREQLNELHSKEIAALDETKQKLDQLNGNIADLDTRTTGRLSWNPYDWFAHGTDITELQNDIKKHNTSEELTKDIEKLDAKIAEYEEQNLRDTFAAKVPDFNSLDKNSQRYKDLKEVYELMLRDKNMRNAHEMGQKDLPDAEKTEYKSLLDSYDPSTMTKGKLPDGTEFNETQEQFEARKAKAQMIQDTKDKVDLSWMDTNEGEDRVKIYSAAKDLKDLAETKKAYAQSKETHETNIKNIEDAQAKK